VSPTDDDLTPFDDDPVLRALTRPGTPAELAGEAETLAAFRAMVPVRSRRRSLNRLGVGGGALGIAVALSGGVAAAYSGALPAPVQRIAHDVSDLLGPIPAAPPPPKPVVASPVHPVTTPSRAAASTAPTEAASTPKPPRRAHHAKPLTKPKPATEPTKAPTPVVTPTRAATPTASPTPTPTDTAPAPSGSITISLSDTTTTPGGTVTAYGQLATSAGAPVAGEEVWLLERVAGDSGVSEVASGTTGTDGSVTLSTPALSHSVRLRLVTAGKVRSAAIAVIVAPTLTVTTTPSGQQTSIRIDTQGGDVGDTVNVEIRRGGVWQAFASNQLDGTGGATIEVTTPTGRPDRYRAILPPTTGHGYAATRFTVLPSGAAAG
jgi:hypothetical protein